MKVQASRPHMPAYALLGPDEGPGLLPWAWAEERLAACHNYWVSTASPDGRPHAMPVWGVWYADALFFSTDASSRKARNLARDPRCSVTTESGAEAVIVEGTAALARDASLLAEVAARYEAKYPMGYPPDSHVYRVTPEVVFGFIEHGDAFTKTATRWRVVG